MTSPAPIDLMTQAESDLFGSLGFTAHLSTLQPVFADLRSGINLIFGAYQIYINDWGALRLTNDARAPTTTPAATIDAVATRAATLRASRDYPPNSRLHATRDCSSGSPAWRSSITRVSKKAVRTPSQVFMAEVDAPAPGGNGQNGYSNTRQDAQPPVEQQAPATPPRWS